MSFRRASLNRELATMAHIHHDSGTSAITSIIIKRDFNSRVPEFKLPIEHEFDYPK